MDLVFYMPSLAPLGHLFSTQKHSEFILQKLTFWETLKSVQSRGSGRRKKRNLDPEVWLRAVTKKNLPGLSSFEPIIYLSLRPIILFATVVFPLLTPWKFSVT